jgi:hypothetical protein
MPIDIINLLATICSNLIYRRHLNFKIINRVLVVWRADGILRLTFVVVAAAANIHRRVFLL